MSNQGQNKCEAKKESGERCEYNASFLYQDCYYCGTHIKKFKLDNQDEYRVNKAAPKRGATVQKKVVPTSDEVLNNAMASIITRVKSKNLALIPEEMTKEDVARIGTMIEMDPEKKLYILRDAARTCGASESVIEIMKQLPASIRKYEASLFCRSMPSETEHPQYSYMRPIKYTLGSPSKHHCSEVGNMVVFPEVNITLLNCSLYVLSDMGYASLSDWMANENHIYMGRMRSVNHEPMETSEWYIQQDPDFTMRHLQNSHNARSIIKKIDDGEENAAKYFNLRGKVLGCTCAPRNCHCEVYVMVLHHLIKASDSCSTCL